MTKYKNYINILFIGIALILFYKSFEYNVFATIFDVLTPLIIGAVMAYFLQPLVSFVDSFLIRKIHTRNLRLNYLLAVFAVFILIIVLISLTMSYVVPAIVNSVINFTTNINDYVASLEKIILDLTNDPGMVDLGLYYLDQVVNTMAVFSSSNIAGVANIALSTSSTIFTTILGIILIPYFLIEKDKLKSIGLRLLGLFLKQEQADVITGYLHKSHVIFGRFIYGKFIDSLIIGVITLILFMVLDIPFATLMALIVGVTNMIPYFGPFIGGIPVVIVTLMVDGLVPGVIATLAVLAIQQFDGLILGPKILGDTVGVSPFWVIASITFFGGLWGFVGMFLAVPLISIIQMLFRDLIEYRNGRQ